MSGVRTLEELEKLRRDWMGNSGILKNLFQELKTVPNEQKPAIAALINTLRDQAELKITEAGKALSENAKNSKLKSTFIDLSLPAQTSSLGVVHPITKVEQRFVEILKPFGIESVFGPEIETEYYCFDSLNIPKHHPARDMQDTFFTHTDHVLRTHTTSVQARTLEARGRLETGKLPVKIATYGRVYRNETEDASHTSMFHQFELVWVEKGLTLSNLMALISHMLKELYGKRRKVRFVPKFYPYTEPSLGAQVDCGSCRGVGCRLCGGAGWSTVIGSGMVHRNVLSTFGYNPDEVSGFAFGFGTTRLAAQMFEFTNVRDIYSNDVRSLKELV